MRNWPSDRSDADVIVDIAIAVNVAVVRIGNGNDYGDDKCFAAAVDRVREGEA